MNAISPALSAARAFPHAELLRRIASAEPIETIDALARDLGRDPSNLRKTLKALEDDGLITRDSTREHGGPNGAGRTLTELGTRVFDALEVVEGQAEVGSGILYLRHDQLKPNPLNPRKSFHTESLTELADSIAATGQIIVPLLVFPPSEDGRRFIAAGERRWRAVEMLIADGRWVPGRLIGCIQCKQDDKQAFLIGLIENGQREDLNPFEQAQGYVDLMEATGWSARQAAFETGKSPRVVQEGVKVVREAAPEAIVRFKAGEITWEALRNTVRQRQAPEQELASSLARSGAAVVAPGGVQTDIEDIAPTHQPPVAQGDPLVWRGIRFGNLTQLNEAKRIAAGDTGATYAAKPSEASTPTQGTLNPSIAVASEPEAKPLSAKARLALVELAHKIQVEPVTPEGRDYVGAWIGEVWLHNEGAELQTARLVTWANPPGSGGWLAVLTDAGREALFSFGLWRIAENGNDEKRVEVNATDLNLERARASQANWPHASYVTPWLNVADPAPAPELPAPPHDAAQDDADEDAQAADDAATLEDVVTFEAAAETEIMAGSLATTIYGQQRQAFGELFERLGVSLPLRADTGDNAGGIFDSNFEEILTIDVNRENSDARAEAIARLVVLAVHIVAGMEIKGCARPSGDDVSVADHIRAHHDADADA